MAQVRKPRRQIPSACLIAWLVLAGGCTAIPEMGPFGITATASRAHWTVAHRFQGDVASCGPSALWSVLTYHLGPGAVDFDQLDRALRPTGSLNRFVGVLPGTLAATATRLGLAATVTNRATTRQLRRLLDAGLPVILLGEYTVGGDSRLHYWVLNGYERQGGETLWIVTDSLEPRNRERRLKTKELMAFWDDVTVFGRPIPYQRAIISIAPMDKVHLLPKDNRDGAIVALESKLQQVFDLLRLLDGGRSATASRP
jgi:hypothetical protein